uniref:hypothetical protein n=1 Tax=Candidatus Fimivicinus sp. TaxID=3056640 RepID=UPI003FF08BB6
MLDVSCRYILGRGWSQPPELKRAAPIPIAALHHAPAMAAVLNGLPFYRFPINLYFVKI